jgi:hypothetical protein
MKDKVYKINLQKEGYVWEEISRISSAELQHVNQGVF